ncbi:MAG: hypothetical protein II767_09470 [Proteobacteria bacterium]|nr:hypothetical protein [Pseudomonadota bacterium]
MSENTHDTEEPALNTPDAPEADNNDAPHTPENVSHDDSETQETVDSANDDADEAEQDDAETFVPSVDMSVGSDITDQVLDAYNTAEDEEAIKAIRAEWRRDRHRYKKPGALSICLMLGVLVIVPKFIYDDAQDIKYFFSSGTPVDLGDANDYRLRSSDETGTSKPQEFEDNRYVRISGIPIRHVGIQAKDNAVTSGTNKLIYQLMGSSVYVQEPMENSRFASFMSKTSTAFGQNMGLEPLEVTGRLQRFDSGKPKKFDPIRKYYHDKYGSVYCETMSEYEIKRKQKLLGKGGVALQILPDGSVFQASTDTNVSLRDVRPLQGSSAVALGDRNTLLYTSNAGLTWSKSEAPLPSQATSLAYDPASRQIVFGGKKGWVGGEAYKPEADQLAISQDILDVAFTAPEPGDTTSPKMVAVGREGLLLTAYIDREGWYPARIDDGVRFNDVLRVGDTWFAAGAHQMLLHKASDSNDVPWTPGVSPVRADWLSLSATPGMVIATGTKGALAKFDLTSKSPAWEPLPFDDVPGIDFKSDIRAAAVSDDGKTWVAVGTNGAILVAKADQNNVFGPVQAISGSYASYGVVRDILAGNLVENALYEALKRHTTEDFHDVTYHDGQFYAVGTDSLLMTSRDGLSWTKRPLHVKHKVLRAIAFTGPQTGVIGGETGTLLVTSDNGLTWHTKKAPTERSIYDIAVTPDYPGGFAFSGAYGLWGFCENTEGRCYLRSRNAGYHYRAIAFAKGAQSAGRLKILVAGDDSHIDRINDNTEPTIHSWFRQPDSTVHDMAFASADLPLRPDSPRGQVGLIAAGNSIYRSYDAGYTFHREESGLDDDIRKLLLTDNGDIACAFDGQNAVLDLHGQGKWKKLPLPGIVDGALRDNTLYLADSKCIYTYAPLETADPQPKTLACLADLASSIRNVAADGGNLSALVHTKDGFTLAQVSENNIQPGAPLPIQPANAPAKLIACAGSHAISQDGALYTATEKTDNVLDVRCLSGSLAMLTAEPTRPGIHRLSLRNDQTQWAMTVGFAPQNAHFARNANGRWWIAAGSSDMQDPLILMSNDTKSWSWRRDRITDFHAVATAQNMAVAVGDNSTILVSENYGESWSPMSSSGNATLRSVCLSSDATYGLAVGDKGTIYRAQNGLTKWSKIKYNFDFDLTSCTIAEGKDRFQIYFTGKGGAIYSAPKDLGRLELISSPAIEDIYSIAALDTGEVIAVGGLYQDPASICESSFLIDADESPRKFWPSVLIAFILFGIWCYTLRALFLAWKHRNDVPPEFDESDNDDEENTDASLS